MGADFTICDGDLLMWMPGPYGGGMAIAPGIGKVKAGAKKVKVGGKKVSLKGDEKKWKSLAPIPYMAPPYVIPGMAMGKVKMLMPDQTTKKVKVEGKEVIIKGMMWMAYLKVMVKAMMPCPPGPPMMDPMPMHMPGMGKFINLQFQTKMG